MLDNNDESMNNGPFERSPFRTRVIRERVSYKVIVRTNEVPTP